MPTLCVCQEVTKGNASSIEQLGAVLCLAETSVLRLQETLQCLWLCWIACMHNVHGRHQQGSPQSPASLVGASNTACCSISRVT